VVYIDPETHQGMRNTQVCPHDILLNITGASLGRCASVPSNFPTANVSQHVTIIRPLMADTRHFIRICLLSPYGQQMIWGRQVGMAREGLSKKVLEQFEIPLPPLAEQKRIVAKVDELMALCDQLEAQQRERQRRFPVLSRTCHARFAEAPTPENLNRIFDETGTVSPDDLRKTIINFAVQGFLVNQEPTDEPAFDAWARIQKVRLAAGEKDFGYLHEDEAPFAIPKGWCWIKMGNLALSSDSGWSPQCESTPRNGTNWGVLKVSAVSWDDFNPDENKAFPAGMSPRPECEVHNGDFLLSRANTEELVARSVVVTTTPPHLMMSDKIVRFNFPEELEKRYINFANSATFARSHYAKHASGTSSSMKNVGRGTMCNLAIPFPPLAEQKRIVSKVDELMALVDQLEAQQQERDKLAEAFAKACVASFTGTTQLERPEKMKAPNF
jgi:type I restriction enzyme S subunit